MVRVDQGRMLDADQTTLVGSRHAGLAGHRDPLRINDCAERRLGQRVETCECRLPAVTGRRRKWLPKASRGSSATATRCALRAGFRRSIGECRLSLPGPVCPSPLLGVTAPLHLCWGKAPSEKGYEVLCLVNLVCDVCEVLKGNSFLNSPGASSILQTQLPLSLVLGQQKTPKLLSHLSFVTAAPKASLQLRAAPVRRFLRCLGQLATVKEKYLRCQW